MKIVLDTDVMVAALRSRTGASRQWLKAVLKGEVVLALSVPLVLQYEEVLLRPQHLKAFGASKTNVIRLIDGLCAVAEPVEIQFLWRPMLRDPGDEMVLEAAVNSGADYLLTFNEKDFKGAEKLDMTVIRPGEAWKRWKRRH